MAHIITETRTDLGAEMRIETVCIDDVTGATLWRSIGSEAKPGTPAAIAAETLSTNTETRDLLRGAAVLIADGTSTAPVSDQMQALGRLALLEAAFADGHADQAVL